MGTLGRTVGEDGLFEPASCVAQAKRRINLRIGILALGAVLLACGIATGITREVKVDKAAPAPAVKSVVKPVKSKSELPVVFFILPKMRFNSVGIKLN